MSSDQTPRKSKNNRHQFSIVAPPPLTGWRLAIRRCLTVLALVFVLWLLPPLTRMTIASRFGGVSELPVRLAVAREMFTPKATVAAVPNSPSPKWLTEAFRKYFASGEDPCTLVDTVYRLNDLFSLLPSMRHSCATTELTILASAHLLTYSRDNSGEASFPDEILTLQIQALQSRDQLLKTAMDRVWIGSKTFGLGKTRNFLGLNEGSEFYFHKPLESISIGQSIDLVIKARYPWSEFFKEDQQRLLKYRHHTIKHLERNGFLTAQEAAEAREVPTLWEMVNL